MTDRDPQPTQQPDNEPVAPADPSAVPASDPNPSIQDPGWGDDYMTREADPDRVQHK